MEQKHLAELGYDRQEIERALFFLSNSLQGSGHNTKPVLLHSIQVAEMLWERALPQDVVMAGVLHDVVEDTDVTVEDIERNFGEQVALYVDALTVSDDQGIDQSFDRCADLGSEALSIRAADLVQNSYYYHLAPIDMQKRLKSKFIRFMDLFEKQDVGSLADDLSNAYERNVKHLPD